MPPSTPHGIITSKSTLMHACLASISPEIQALDSILHATHREFSSNRVALPTEILLLIREWLFPEVTAGLLQRSTIALEAYEHGLRNLLCPDCIAYNLDIFGSNIWQWEHFDGPCACLEIGSGLNVGHGSVRRDSDYFPDSFASPTPAPNPNDFVDAQEWLEAHLSKEAASLLKSQSLHIPAVTPSAETEFSLIWDVVHFILQSFNSQFLFDPEDPEESSPELLPESPSTPPLPPKRHDLVHIIPSHKALGTGTDSHLQDEIILRCTARDLCLKYTEPFGAHKRDTSSFRASTWRPNTRAEIEKEQQQVKLLFGIVAAGVAACLLLPITFSTVAITIVFFYSKPRSFRTI